MAEVDYKLLKTGNRKKHLGNAQHDIKAKFEELQKVFREIGAVKTDT